MEAQGPAGTGLGVGLLPHGLTKELVEMPFLVTALKTSWGRGWLWGQGSCGGGSCWRVRRPRLWQ